VHSDSIDDRPEFRALVDQRFILTRPLAIAEVNGPSKGESVTALDDRTPDQKSLHLLPSTLATGTVIELKTFYEDRQYAITVWPLYLDLFPSPPKTTAWFVTPGAAWGAPKTVVERGALFIYDYKQIPRHSVVPWSHSEREQPTGHH
jgi:hypothetical protein